MKKGISKIYYAIPVLYVILIAVLIYLHFESGIGFEEKMKGYTLSGEYQRGKKGRIKSIDINFGDFILTFSHKTPLKMKIQENDLTREIVFQPINYSIIGENDTSLTFVSREEVTGNKIKIILEITTTGEKFAYIRPIFNQSLKPDGEKELIIPFKTLAKRIDSTEHFPISSFNGKYITLPYGSYIHYRPNEIALKISKKITDNTIHIFTRSSEEKNLPLTYLTDRLNLRTKTEGNKTNLEKKIDIYTDKAFNGWIKRFDREKYKWRVDSKYVFNEKIEAAVVSETLWRNKGDLIRTYLTALRIAMRENPDSLLPYITSPYFGGLKKFVRITHQKAKKFSTMIRREINQLKSNFLKKPNIVIHLLDMAPYSLLEETTKYVDSLEIENLNTETAIYLLNYYTELIKHVGYKKIHLERINTLIDKKILPAITILEQKEIQIEQKGNINPYLSLLAGIDITLIKELSPIKHQIGNLLIDSTLKLSDNMGIIQGIHPEDIYPLLCRIIPRYYPKEIPMFKISKPGEWLWTAAELKKISFFNKTLEIKLQYLPKQPHFILVQGVGKPKEVILHNITWRPDRYYYNYRDGWFYEEKTQSLFIKYTNRKRTETLKIIF